MGVDYKNWVPKGMIMGFLSCTLASFFLFILLGLSPLIGSAGTRRALFFFFLILTLGFMGVTVWMALMHWAYSYHGRRQLSKEIISEVASHVSLPDGGIGLDVGCGSGALTIACAKKNPRARMTGIDHWGPEYASFSKKLCEDNAKAEGTANVTFEKGDAVHLDFPDETFDAVTSNYVYHNIPARDRKDLLLETLRVLKKGGTFAIHDIFSKGKYGDMEAFVKKLREMGFKDVSLIDTTDGKPITKWESCWLMLKGSALLVGRKSYNHIRWDQERLSGEGS